MNVTVPMRDLMVVERFELVKTTAGGILLPGDALDTNTAKGRVLTVGPGALDPKTGELKEVDVKVGDTVLFHMQAGIKVSDDGETPELFLLREEDILVMIDA